MQCYWSDIWDPLLFDPLIRVIWCKKTCFVIKDKHPGSCFQELRKNCWLKTSVTYPGSKFFHHGSRVRKLPDPESRVKKFPDPGSGTALKNFSIINHKNWYKLLEIWLVMFIPDQDPGSRIWIFSIKDPDTVVKKGVSDQDMQHC